MSVIGRVQFLYYKIKYPNELKTLGVTKYDPSVSVGWVADDAAMRRVQRKIEKANKINENDGIVNHFNSVMKKDGFEIDEYGFCDKPNNIFKKIHNHFFDLKEDNYIENKSWALKYEGGDSVVLYRCKTTKKAEIVFDIIKDRIAENIKYGYDNCKVENKEDKFIVRCDDEESECTDIVLLGDKVVFECSLYSDIDGKYEKEIMGLLNKMGYEV